MARVAVLVAALAAALVFSAAHAQIALDPESVVATTAGKVLGELNQYGRSFRGVPYAAPPVGREGRFRPPRPAKSWGTDPLMTRDFQAGCPQECVDSVGLPPHACPMRISEDCLYLNVYTPRGVNEESNLPVLVWFPGGNFDKGMSNLLYEGIFMANRSDVIVVTVTYRLGALGFLMTSTLNDGNVTNLGIEDQRMSLIWVRDNIRNFGGNPNLVTIYGQSAGGRSVSVHLTSKGSQGLFQQAIIQSDPLTIVCSSKEDALALGDRFLTALGCDINDIDCLYYKDWEQIIEAQDAARQFIPIDEPISAFMQILPTVDGDDLPDQPMNLMLKGEVADVPIIMGTVLEETVLYIFLGWPNPVDEATYRAIARLVFKENATQVLERYPPIEGDQRPQMWTMGTDYVFSCPDRYTAIALARTNPTYVYVFDQPWSFDGWGPYYDFCVPYSCHGADMPFVFGTTPIVYPWTPAEAEVSNAILDYFGNFAWTGNPNIAGATQRRRAGAKQLTPWPPFNGETLQSVRLTSPEVLVETGFQRDACDFFDVLSYDPIRKGSNYHQFNPQALFKAAAVL